MSLFENVAPNVEKLRSGSGNGYIMSVGGLLHQIHVSQGSAVGTLRLRTSSGGTIAGQYTIPLRTQGQGTFVIDFRPPRAFAKLYVNRINGGTGAGINAKAKYLFRGAVRVYRATPL